MNAKQQLAVVEAAQKMMRDAKIDFAIVARFPAGGGAFLCGDHPPERLDENGQTLADNLRYYATEFLDTGATGGIICK